MAATRAKSPKTLTKAAAPRTRTPKVKVVTKMVPQDVTARDPEGRTPLHLAAFHGYAIMVSQMLLQQADVNARDNQQRTPGHWSAYKGHLDVIKMLLESGADINARDAEGRTLLRMAVIGRQSAIEELLRMQGAEL